MKKEKILAKYNDAQKSIGQVEKKVLESKKKIAGLVKKHRTGKDKVTFQDFETKAALGTNQIYNMLDPTKTYTIDTMIKACHVMGVEIKIGDITIK